MSFIIRAQLAPIWLSLSLFTQADLAGAATPLTLEEAEQLALANQPLLASQQASITAAESDDESVPAERVYVGGNRAQPLHESHCIGGGAVRHS